MSATPTAGYPPVGAGVGRDRFAIGLLRGLLLAEALGGVAVAVFLSLVASALRDVIGGDAGVTAEQNVRFVAGFSFVFAILAAFTSRGARRRRPWSWTMAALLQLAIAIGTGIAVLVATWHPAYLLGFALPVIVMLVLSSGPVRRALGQE
jgi:predicted Co/Zn/Cd cation transporter (cation efflux family)